MEIPERSLAIVFHPLVVPTSPHLTPTRYCARLAIRPVHSHRIKVARAMRLASLPNDNCLPGVKAVEEKYVIRLEECAIKREVSFVQIRLKSRSPSSSLLFNLHSCLICTKTKLACYISNEQIYGAFGETATPDRFAGGLRR